METRKIIDAIDHIKDAQGEEALALQLIRWYLTRSVSPPTGGIKGGSGGSVSWSSLLKFAQKQALVGVMFEGIQRLPKELSPKGPVLLAWIAQAQMIERQSRKLNAATAAVYQRIKELGAECCILKGQGNALLYKNPLSRMPGDVDVWCPLKRREERGKRKENSFAGREGLRAIAAALTEGHGTIGHESYNHIEMMVDGIPVELHPTPAILNCPIHDRRLQRWLEANAKAQCENMVELPDGCGQIAIPTREFNLVYQLLHLYHHHLFEGIGLRQFVDYALLIERREEPTLGGRRESQRGERKENRRSAAEGKANSFDNLKTSEPQNLKTSYLITSNLKTLNLTGFAGAVMYVLQEVFALPDDQLLVPVDKKRGKLLLADILHGGNFGHYDQTFAKNALGHNLQRIWRDIRLMRYYPAETLCEPLFRLWHWAWRKRQRI